MVELAGPRVLLREVRAADVALIHAGASDPAVVRYMSWGPNDEAATGAFVERCLASQEIAPRGSMDLVFEAVGDGRFRGICGFERDADDPSRASMDYWLMPTEWGRGYATEAAGLLLAHALDVAGITEVCAAAALRNTASQRVLEKIGMTRVGPWAWNKGGRTVAAVQYSTSTP